MLHPARSTLIIFLLTLEWLFTPPALCAQVPAAADLKTLVPAHPRLLWTDERIAAVKTAVEQDPLARRWEQRLEADAEKMLKQPPVEHVLIGPRLLDKSRTTLDRVSTLAGLYRLTGDKRYAERAKKELMTVAAFDDWNPSHFLDVAEMTNAVALGYDWLFDYLSADERTALRQAIVKKGLEPGLAVYAKKSGWHMVSHNWNQVCNGGMTVGALAIADEEPEVAGKVIAAGRASIPRAMAGFAPDGGWPEGPGYWNYATRYNVFYLAALETALGTDFGLTKTPGFADTGNFRIQLSGPTGLTFNFADGGSEAGTAAQLFWLARTFNNPACDAFERKLADNKPSIFDLVWFNTSFSNPQAAEALNRMPASQCFKGTQVAFLRSGPGREAEDEVYVGFKGGDNRANHAHLDLGTFVLDALGRRWALDMGGDEYNMPGYFGAKRWTYYRLRTEGHNTITLDGVNNQDPRAAAPIVLFDDAPARPLAVADLTEAYRPRAQKVLRGIALVDGRQACIQDELQAPEPVDVTWHFHTDAKVEVDGATATLSQPAQGKLPAAAMRLRILSPAGAHFEVIDANPAPPQRPAPRTRDLTIHLPKKVKEVRIVVVIGPVGQELEQAVRPLSEWGKIQSSVGK
jgi:hypothetical protein